ncbi:MAG: DUF4276 family protein [Deltaproteobacteria bacterium]|jgi:hypothetical protein|nr:DUF4276 family protein [Deltaproteobacteria bacterium]
MSRIHIFCEGITEEIFVRELLRPHFESLGIWLNSILVGGRAGGVNTYGKIRREIDIKCKEDSGSYVTTLLDYYAFPTDGVLYPMQESDPIKRAKSLVTAFQQDIGHRNFIANLVVHEYEGLLFSRPESFETVFNRDTAVAVKAIRNSVLTPEHIDDGKESAPSKRLKALLKNYDKTRHGLLLAKNMGLDSIRKNCLTFDAWLTCLENLPVDSNQNK